MPEENLSNIEWMDDAYIQKILSTYEKQNIEIIQYEKEPATSKGENFASALHRVRVQYCLEKDSELKSLSMIIKSRLEMEYMEAIESNFNIFQRESQLYRNIMLRCEDLLKSIGDNTRFGPRPLYIDERVIVMEDLKENGFAIMEVRKGLDKEHCRRVLEKLAKFHATTRILYEKDPELFTDHMAPNLTETPTPMYDVYKNTMTTCIEYASSNNELLPYLENLKSCQKDIIQKEIDVFVRNSKGFNTLNHGDVWVNNLMFKKDIDGNIEDILFVDFQEGCFGSPGIDLNYFIYSSWTKDTYENCRQDLFNDYFNVLKETLNKLHANEIPTLDSIIREIKSKADHGLVTALCILPILINENPELVSTEIFFQDDKEANETRLKIFNNPNYGRALKTVLPDFIKEKLL